MTRSSCSRAVAAFAAACAAALPSAAARAQSRFGGGWGQPFPGWTPPSAVGNSALVQTLLSAVLPARRADAARRLGDTGDPGVIPALSTAATNDSDFRVRREATEAIERIRRVAGGPRPPGPGWPGLVPGPGPGWGGADVELVRSWYERFLGRSPDAEGLRTWVGFLRSGMSPEDVQGGILGSDEYFNRNGRRLDEFVRGLYRDVLGREPSRNEVRGWLDRLARFRGDRARLAAEFVRTAQAELNTRPGFGFF